MPLFHSPFELLLLNGKFCGEAWDAVSRYVILRRCFMKEEPYMSAASREKRIEKSSTLTKGWDCLYRSIYNPDEEMCMLFEDIAAYEGMFFRLS